MTTESIEAQGIRCCMEHLERIGAGVIVSGTVDGVTTETLLMHPNHCRDRQRARCRTCRKVWEHIHNEAACEWVCRSRGPKR